MKKGDFFLIILYISLSLILMYNIVSSQNSATSETYVIAKLDGEIIFEEPLPVDSTKTIPIETEHGLNVIEINAYEVNIIEADCPDQLCVYQKVISKPGQILVCLPNHLTIEIVGDQAEDIDINSY